MLRKTSKHEDTESLLRNEMEKEDLEIEALRAKAEERRRRQEEDLRRQEEEKARIEAEKRAKEVFRFNLYFLSYIKNTAFNFKT
jgi:hypothetical protein